MRFAVHRDVMGATNPAEAEAGTIRADFANSIDENAVHGSDAPETAAQEIAIFLWRRRGVPTHSVMTLSKQQPKHTGLFVE